MPFKFKSTVDKRGSFLLLTKFFGFCLYRGNYRILPSLVSFRKETLVTRQQFLQESERSSFFWISDAEQHWNTALQYHLHISCPGISPYTAVTILVKRTTKVNTWTWSPQLMEGRKIFRELPWIKHLGCGYRLSKGLCICQTCSNTARVTFHLKQGNKPSHPSPFSPALYLWPQAVAKGSGSDPADSTWLLTPPSYKSKDRKSVV